MQGIEGTEYHRFHLTVLLRTPAKVAISAALLAASFFASSCGSTKTRPTIAVASNFNAAAEEIAARFEKKTGNKVNLVFGSTGKTYAQIKNGAPYDAFLAADSAHPRLLEDEGIALKNSRITYAYGRLVLWGPEHNLNDGGRILANDEFNRLAIANPKLAPYGAAAIEVLAASGLDANQLGRRLIRGENVAQVFQFVKTGNVEYGFVAYSQIIQDKEIDPSSVWTVPGNLYTAIEQQGVLLTQNQTAREFMIFLNSPEALEVIRRYGYGTP